MDNKVKNANQRLKILYLYKILLERSDEEHSITMPEIISQLKLYPYNFRELLWLLDINPSILDDEECELDVNSY